MTIGFKFGTLYVCADMKLAQIGSVELGSFFKSLDLKGNTDLVSMLSSTCLTIVETGKRINQYSFLSNL